MIFVRKHSYGASSLLLNSLMDYFRGKTYLVKIDYPVGCGRYCILHWPAFLMNVVGPHLYMILFYVLFLVFSKDYFHRSIYKKEKGPDFYYKISSGKANGIKFVSIAMTIQVETTSRITFFRFSE